MNIILFHENEIQKPLHIHDPRVFHIKKILKLGIGGKFHAGIINGKIGEAEIKKITPDFIEYSFTPKYDPTPLFPIIFLIGMIRPIAAKRVLRDLTTLGISEIRLFNAETSEKSYRESNLWENNNFREHLIEGASQGFTTLLPEIKLFYSLKACIKELPENYNLIAFDNNESGDTISKLRPLSEKAIVAIGSERGFTPAEIEIFKKYNFNLYSLGKRILRTETAVTFSAGIILDKFGYLK